MRLRALYFALFVTTALAQPAATGWRAIIHPGDLENLNTALEKVKSMHTRLDAKAYGRADVPKVETLVESTSLPFADSELLGAWKCRSIQGSSLGIFSYPPFPARISSDKGRLRFEKTGGSQLRRGFLYPDGSNQRRIFLGKQYVRGEKPVTEEYSGHYKDADGESSVGDTFGVLVKKAGGKFVLILDANDERYEIYEMTR